MAQITLACRFIIFNFLAVLSFNLAAQETSKQYIGYYESDNVTNQIPYFDNRFRLDANLDEITLIFYRKSGTPPIILVRPDGSKLKVDNHPKDRVQWYDDRTFDMIKIKQPMPGPWQAVGDILPQSKIMVVSDVYIEVEPIPEVVLEGETLKMVGRLINGEQEINEPLFREAINLDVDFYSTNNSAYDNFGAEPIQLTTFRDDGEELDEYANDGVFTGEFLLDFAPGEWVPIYIVKLPMMTRELRQKPIVIQRTPITISAEITHDEHSFHKIIFDIDPTYVDPDSIIFQGKFTTPDRQVEPFSIMEGQGKQRIENMGYTEPGIHRVKVNVFGRTTEGREFRLVMPEYVFNVEPQEVLLAPNFSESNAEADEDKAETVDMQKVLLDKKKQMELALQAELEAQAEAAEKEQAELMLLIGVINGVIIFLALCGLGFYLWKQKTKKKKGEEV